MKKKKREQKNFGFSMTYVTLFEKGRVKMVNR